MSTKPNREIALDAVKRIGSFSEGEKDALLKAFRTSMFPGNWSTGTPADGDTLVYDDATDSWEFVPAGVGDLKADGTVPLTANWDMGPFDITIVDIQASGNVNVDGRLTVGNGDLLTQDQFYMYGSGSAAAVINFDLNDFIVFTRLGDTLNFYIDGQSRMELSPTVASVQAPLLYADGNLWVNGQIVSGTNADIDLAPNGTGNVLLGNLTFDADQTVGAGQDNYVLTYDNAAGLIQLEPSAAGFADPMTTRGDIIVRDAANATARLAIGASGYVLTSDGTDIAWAPSVSGVSEFTGLNDVPSSYVGQANKFLRVNAGATGIEFTSATPVTQVTASSPMASSGGTTPNLTIQASSAAQNGYMSSTQAAKLDTIESGADVTDAANVAAAGAYMKTVTVSTSAPSGGNNGDVWYQVV